MEQGKLSRSQKRRLARDATTSPPIGQFSVTPPQGATSLVHYPPNGLNKINSSQGPVSNLAESKPSVRGTIGQSKTALNPSNNGPEPKPSGTQPAQVREHDLYMPIANIVRTMRRALPRHAKVSDEAKEMVQECVSEFISFVTGEANDACHTEHRKTITAEDIIAAMSRLGFDNYVEPLTVYLQKHRESEMLPSFTRRGGYEPGIGGARVGAANGLPTFSMPLQFGTLGSPSGSGGGYHDGLGQTNVGPTHRDAESPSPCLGREIPNGAEENELAGQSTPGVGFQPYVAKK